MRFECLCGDSFEMELECSWLGRQGQGFCCRNYVESSCVYRQGRVFVARFTLFQTRIKGLTRIV